MNTLLQRVTYLSVDNAVNGALGVAFVPAAVARLGTIGYGVFSIHAVLFGYVVLADLGIGKNLLRLLAREPEDHRRQEHLSLALGLYLTIAVALLALVPLFVYIVPRFVFPVPAEYLNAVGWITILATIEYVVGIPTALVRTGCVADEQFDRYSKFVAASGFLRYGLGFGAIFVFTRPELVVAVIVSRRVGDFLLARWIMGWLPKGSWRPRFHARQSIAMIGHSSMLSVARLLQITVVSVGSVLVNHAFGLRSLGVYRSMFDIVSKVWFFSNTLGVVVFPGFVRLLADAGGRRQLRDTLPAALRVSWVAYGTLAVLGSVVGSWVLPRVGMIGTEYQHLFVTLLVGVSFNAHANVSYEFLQAMPRSEPL